MNTSKLLKLLQGVVALALLASSLGACSVPHVATPGPEEARAIAEEAYIFAYPMLENYRTMYIQAVAASAPTFKAPFNRFVHSTVLLGPEFKDIVRPNNDTLYSTVWMDLRAEPLVISVPEIKGRYYSFQLVDMYTHNFAYIGTRATGTAAGSYLVAGPAWTGDKPAGVAAVLRTEGNFVYSLTRTAVSGKEDVPNVAAIQQQYRVQPLSAFLGRSAPASAPSGDFPAYDKTAAESADFIKYFNYLLGQLVVHPSEQALIARFGRIGVGPNRTFDAAALGADTRRALDDGVTSARQKIKDQSVKLGTQKNHWNLVPRIWGNREQMQGQYLIRAAAAYAGLYGNDLEEAYYPSTNWDAAGAPLDGSQHSYVLKLAQGEIPAVDAFWSLTMYSQDGLLVENPIQRYSIGDRTAGLKYGADGSLELYIQRESPGKDKEANWLPAPNGRFSLTMRMYLPKAAALNPLYAPPGIQKRD